MTNHAAVFADCIEKLSRLPVARHPGLMFQPGLEGYRDYTFGARAGPAVEAVNLFHELAHAAQFGAENFSRRATSEGFVFKTRRIFVYNTYCEEPRTSKATRRELETFAYQLHLMRLAGFTQTDDDFMSDHAKVMRFMPDWWHIPGNSDEKRAKWCQAYIAKRYAKLKPDEVVGRLDAWLDKTWLRLNQSGKKGHRSCHPVEQRYLTTGAAYVG
ncbi:hypothetical protein LC612_30135 [Nostoc sp. CHAB 5834]|nr:hypothetical protein [Nostoc sp. CHAB 5834]